MPAYIISLEKEITMGCRSLAEAVILQSIEDLWNPLHREESKEFFKGEGLKIYAEIAELNSPGNYKLIHSARGRENAGTARAQGS